MLFISYAPNAEDVVLWRALRHIGAGCYVDWVGDGGASITRAFYDRGWSGVSVCATRADADALAARRPRDVVTTAAEFDHVAVPRVVHFMRASSPALQATGLAAVQPWIVLAPAGDAEAAACLETAGYRAALYDGVNRFYAASQSGLAESLAAPANSADNYRRAVDEELAGRVDGLQAALEAADLRTQSSRAQLLDALRLAGQVRDKLLEREEEAGWLRGLATQAQEGEERHAAEAAWLRGQLDAYRSSGEDWLRQLATRANEVAWLRGCLAEINLRAADLDARLRRSEAEWAALRASRAWRSIERLRGALGVWQPPPPSAALPEPPQAPHAEEPVAVPAAPPPAIAEPVPPMVECLTPPVPAQPALPAEAPRWPAPVRPVWAVHQFHAGSAPHDAITNAMLMIRTQLRRAGFRSEIYVESRREGVEDGIRLLDEMPQHAEYVLLLHHSMGHPGFDQVLALPAAKVLVYHNITPPEFLGAQPRIQRLAELGRAQLAELRGHACVALSDSAFNAVELRRLGFDTVRACPLLFDVDALARPDGAPRPGDGVFTVLFVGRVTPSKGQDALVDAFAAFRARFGRPCRLVLVGALDADEHAFIDRIAARIAAHGLEGAVQLPGLVPDEELRGWYRQADLYVSLSRHEGFGVPLVEAAAHGIPVVAWPTGAVPYTLAQAGLLLTSCEPDDVAQAMLDAAGQPRRAPAGLARFGLARQWPVLMAALATAGALPPMDAGTRRDIAANMRFAVAGHVRGSYSLAAVNRRLAAVLEAQRPGAVRLLPVEGAPVADPATVPEEVQALAARDRPDTGPELVISNHYPVHRPAEGADLAAALFFWEESLIPAATVAVLNGGFDLVLAPSRFVAKALVDSGVAIPVVTVGQAPELPPFAPRAVREPFTFLHVSSAFARKGVDVLLDCWAQAFTAADPVRLVIKTFPNPHNEVAAQLGRLRQDHPDAAEIVLIDAERSGAELAGLYAAADAMVLPTRGEGYNLPAAEAMASGLPLIVTGHGGHLDFCGTGTARLVRRGLAPSGSHLAPPHSLWAEPDRADLVAALREAAAGGLAQLAAPARDAIAASADPAAFTSRLAEAAASVLLMPAPRPLRTAWVTSWDVRCGVAEYTRALLGALPRDGLGEPVILADDRTAASALVRPSWRAGDAGSAPRLASAVAQADPDVLVVQHQPGLLPWSGLADLLEATAEAGRSRVVTLHNTRHLLDVPEEERGRAAAALATADRVLVHSLADLQRLDRLGLSGVATLLPHPAPPPTSGVVRPLPHDAAPVVGCTGFFLPDKGIDGLIAAVARLRARWPAIRLRLVNAEYPDRASATAIAACRAAAMADDLAVEWQTEFLPLGEQQALLRGCDLIVLPYQRSKEGSSAALRSALGAGVPVAVTPLELFDEAAEAVFRLPGCEPAPMALGIAHLLGSVPAREHLCEAARAWLEMRALPDVAVRLAGMLRGLAAQRRLAASLTSPEREA